MASPATRCPSVSLCGPLAGDPGGFRMNAPRRAHRPRPCRSHRHPARRTLSRAQVRKGISQLQTPCPALDLVLTALIGFDLLPSNMKSARNHVPNSWVTDLLRSLNQRGKSTLSQTIIETVQQKRNCLFGFVAHIGEAEGFALNFAVAGIDDEMMFSAQFFRQFQNVDALVVFHASECL